ncbi:hypothetical protein K3165_03770 [Qipengyuania sp. 1XM1-15A]|uniref:anti-sigma factor family protein n=1 Tax=Qipengyuania xiamenensis TaxID=2867237 RepID=UPI001C88C07F|nr:hypothetical protein [Qipengyuania xiamenensis]MBX7532040.1 hypothetical protein [Qipengyuania xiamenensis]
MTKITDEMLSAYIDGELGASQAAEIGTALNNDPALRARLEEFEQANETVRHAASVIENRPVPASVLSMLDGTGAIFSTQRISTYWPTALAASLALVVGLGVGSQFLATGGDAAPTPYSPYLASRIYAGDPLFAAFDATPSNGRIEIGENGAELRPVLSFTNRGGEPCREAQITGDGRTINTVACREADAWRVDFALRSETTRDTQGYQTASASDLALINAYVDQVMNGDAFSSEEEAATISGGWLSD